MNIMEAAGAYLGIPYQYKLRRAGWRRERFVFAAQDWLGKDAPIHQVLRMQLGIGDCCAFMPSREDLLADDWIAELNPNWEKRLRLDEEARE